MFKNMAIDEKNTDLVPPPLQVQTELFVVERQLSERQPYHIGNFKPLALEIWNENSDTWR